MASQRKTFTASLIWMLLLPPLVLVSFEYLPAWGAALAPMLLTLPAWLILRESPLGIFLDLSVASLIAVFIFLLVLGLFGEEYAYLTGAALWALSPFLGWRLLRSGSVGEAAAWQSASNL